MSTTGGAPGCAEDRGRPRRPGVGRQPAADHVRVVDGRREPDPAAGSARSCCSRARPSASRSPRLEGQIAWTSSMITQRQVLEIAPRALPGAEQGQLLGRGEQDVRRLDPLALAARDAGVAGARLGLDRQAHLGDRRHQVAFDVDRQGLQRRDVEGVDAGAAALRGGRSASSIRLGRNPARVLPPPVGAISRASRPPSAFSDHGELMRPAAPAAAREPRGEGRRRSSHGRRPPSIAGAIACSRSVSPRTGLGRVVDASSPALDLAAALAAPPGGVAGAGRRGR